MKRPGTRRACPATALRRASAVACSFALVFSLLMLAGCGGDSGGTVPSDSTSSEGGSTSGPAFTPPDMATSSFDAESAVADHDSLIDVSHAARGYVSASAQNTSRMKLLVTNGEVKRNYDLPGDGTPIAVPLTLGDGTYDVQIMQNTSGNSYVAINSVSIDVVLDSEFEPYLHPNLFCDYDANSASVAKANELAAGAENEGDVLRNIYTWIADNIAYDTAKADELAEATGYVPNPDATLAEKKGICFDYVSLGAAMLRSQGIPTKIITGYVSPDNIYHAWNMVYLDGSWTSVRVSVDPDTWTRIDLTFAAAGGAEKYVGNAKEYTDRYTY